MKNKIIVGERISLIEIYRPSDELYYYVLVDTEDLPLLREQIRTVSLKPELRTDYAQAWMKDRSNKPLHRVIMDTPKGLQVDHINHDGLDNRKSNLQNLTPQAHTKRRRKNYAWQAKRRCL